MSFEQALAIEIPLPPLDEQKRIAAILDKADAIRGKRQQTIELADQFLRSVFLDMFGDPVTNPKGLTTKKLKDVANFISGATPSKSNKAYWSGDYPWVSPKDMKSDSIANSQDHISESVFEKTNQKKIPAGAILIVVRGMILVHTVPLGLTTRDVAINQDIKALIVGDQLLPSYLFFCLKCMHSNLLSKVGTAAHGTKRIDMEDLYSIEISMPSVVAQEKFVSIVNKYEDGTQKMSESLRHTENGLQSITQQAFKGELTQSKSA